MPVGHLCVAPTSVSVDHHENIGSFVAFVFIIVAFRTTGFGRHRHPRLANQLSRCFIEAHDGPLGIRRFGARQGDERLVLLRIGLAFSTGPRFFGQRGFLIFFNKFALDAENSGGADRQRL